MTNLLPPLKVRTGTLIINLIRTIMAAKHNAIFRNVTFRAPEVTWLNNTPILIAISHSQDITSLLFYARPVSFQRGEYSTPRFGNFYRFQQPRPASPRQFEYICYYHRRFRQNSYSCEGPHCKYFQQLQRNNALNGRGWQLQSAIDCRRAPFSFGRGCKLLRAFDCNNRISFLIDTGSSISIIPASSRERSRGPDCKVLYSATSKEIRAYGEQVLDVNFGAEKNYPWCFTKTNLNFCIIGIDFLTAYQLTVDSFNRCLIDQNQNLVIPLSPVYSATPPTICCVCPEKSEFHKILSKYPNILNPPVTDMSEKVTELSMQSILMAILCIAN